MSVLWASCPAPIISDYCTNCGKMTGVPREDAYDPSYNPKKDEVLLKYFLLSANHTNSFPTVFES